MPNVDISSLEKKRSIETELEMEVKFSIQTSGFDNLKYLQSSLHKKI